MIDRIVKMYQKINRNTRSVLVFILAAVIALSTLHILTFPATAVSRRNGEEIPGISPEEHNEETDPQDGTFDNAQNPEPASEAPSAEPQDPDANTNEPAPQETAAPENPEAMPAVTPEPAEAQEGEGGTEVIEEVLSEPAASEAAPEATAEESDPEADVETAADWEAMFKDIELTGIWADDLLEIAESQIGYEESTANFIIDDDDVKRGYTRYGAWHGDPYAKWDTLFIQFSMYYAGITSSDMPYETDCEDWVKALREKEMFFNADSYIPTPGDLVFADTDEDGKSDHAAIVKAVEYNEGRPDKLVVIEGDAGNEVKQSRYEFYEPMITGFAKLPENPALEEAEETKPEETLPVYTLTGQANRVDVTVEYEEGAFPEGTTMEVKTVGDRNVISAINEKVAEENKEVVRVQAVDIIFRDAAGNEIEPAKPVRVTMKSRSVPQAATEKPTVVHVDAQNGAKVIQSESPENEPSDTKQAVTFEAGSFSVYAMVYTIETYYTSFDGNTYKITLGYTADAKIPEGAELDVREILSGSQEYDNYLNESAETLGITDGQISFARFFDIRILDGETVIEPAAPVQVTVSYADPVTLAEDARLSVVHFGTEEPEVITDVTLSEDSRELTYTQNSFSVTGTIIDSAAGWWDLPKEYAVIIEYNSRYYSLHPDGSLEEVTSAYDPETNRINVDLEYPLAWKYQIDGNYGYNLCVPTVAIDFYDNNLPTGYYYRYIDPSSASGLKDEDKAHPDLRAACGIKDMSGNTISSRNGSYYIGVSEEGGLHIIGRQTQENAAVVHLAELAVPSPVSETHDTHMVNHIDIAIAGDSKIQIPLAYGDYYNAAGKKVYTASKDDHILEMNPVIDITTEDMKKATITASADVNGEYKELDNAFYITGYSQNHDTGQVMAQVRIEGSFKVSNIPDAQNADNDPAVRQARKANPITYSVSVPKTVRVEVTYNGEKLYDEDGDELVFDVPVNLSASFNYWDEHNQCPPLHINYDEHADFVQEWKDGKIVGTGPAMSGMDFELGTSASSELGVPAIEINKVIQDESGAYIKTLEPHDFSVDVYRSGNSADTVIDAGVSTPLTQEELNALTAGSRLMHSKKVTAGKDGFGSTYDYDVPAGLIHITEDPESIEQYITASDGTTYQYVGTRMETEYAWRTDGDESKLHNAEGNTSVPEVLGPYSYGGEDQNNGFLEFFIYNIYKPVPPVNVPIDKSWDEEINNDPAYDWTVTVVLEEMEIHESGPQSPEANTSVWRTVAGQDPKIIHKGDSEAARSFTGLPKYRYYDVDGEQSVYRILYSIEETAYELKQNGTVISKWDNVNGLTVGDTTYGPTFPHDAGDAEDESGIGPDDPRFYHVIVENHKKDETVIDTLTDLRLRKVWEDGALEEAGVDEKDAFATFQLKRYVTTEHVSYDPQYYDGTDASVTLIGQDGHSETLTVKKGAKVRIAATFGTSGAARYTVDGTGDNIDLSWYSGSSDVISRDVVVKGDMTIRSNNESWMGQHVSEDHLELAAGSGSETKEDQTFTNEQHFYTLNREKGWLQVIDNLPLYTEGAVHNGEQNLYHYSYYFAEVDSNPAGFYSEFTDGDGNPIGDASHRITEDHTSVNAENRKVPEFYVKKEWHDIEDPDSYPEIRFTLYQGVIGTDWSGNPEIQDKKPFVGSNGESYRDIPLNSDNGWSWKCPGYLPETDENGRQYVYYAVENTNSGSNWRAVNLYENSVLNPDGSIKVPGALITAGTPNKDQVWLWDYYNSKNDKHAYRNDQQMPRGEDGAIDANTGTLTIVNRSPKYMQMDIKKKIMEFQPDGSLATTTGWPERTKDIVLKIQLMRRIYAADAPVNAEPLVDWENYGTPFYVGYDSQGHDINQNDNDFDVGVGLSSWHWTIMDQNQENGLPAYGYLKQEDGTYVKVHYRYIPFEIGAYKNLDEEPLSEEYDWFVGLQPNAWDGAYGEVATFSPMIGQDQDRLMNIQASDLYVDKVWDDTPGNVQEVYVKIWRQAGNNEPEDFTEDIATRTDILNVYGFVDDPSRLSTLDNGVLVLGITPETGGVLIHNVLLTPVDNGNLNTNFYHYWVEEVAYKDTDGNVHYDVDKFQPRYTRWQYENDGQSYWVPSWDTEPEANKIKLVGKGNNKLRIGNTPTIDVSVHKAWIDKDGNLLSGPFPHDPEITSINFKIRRTEQLVDGEGNPIGDPIVHVLTFNGSETITISETGKRYQAAVTENAQTSYTLTEDTSAEVDMWTTVVDGLQECAVIREQGGDGGKWVYTYEIIEATQGDWNVTVTGNPVTHGSAAVTITNEDQPKKVDLPLKKELTGEYPEGDEKTKLFTFRIEFTGKGVNGTYPLEWTPAEADPDRPEERPETLTVLETTVGSGRYQPVELKLLAGETVTIKGLPAGMGYTVSEPEESMPENYTLAEGEASRSGENVTETPETIVFVNKYEDLPYELEIVKKDLNDQEIRLAGAVFRLTQLDETKAPVSGVPVHKKDSEGQDIILNPAPAQTDSTGKQAFTGIRSGIYELREVTPPPHYLLTGDEVFYLRVDSTGITLLEKGSGAPETWQAKEPDGKLLSLRAVQEKTNSWQAVIGNESGAPLPMTGGTGTAGFTIAGILLILLGAFALRKNQAKS